jgi:hypothetical protein
MTDPVRAKIESEIDETLWYALAVHAQRDALFLVDPSLNLADVAHAIATNRTAIVAHWIDAALMKRPSADERAALDAALPAPRFRIAIVQPFVLAQPLPAPSSITPSQSHP